MQRRKSSTTTIKKNSIVIAPSPLGEGAIASFFWYKNKFSVIIAVDCFITKIVINGKLFMNPITSKSVPYSNNYIPSPRGPKGIEEPLTDGKYHCAYIALLQLISHVEPLYNLIASIDELELIKKLCDAHRSGAPVNPHQLYVFIRDQVPNSTSMLQHAYGFVDLHEILLALLGLSKKPLSTMSDYTLIEQYKPISNTLHTSPNKKDCTVIGENNSKTRTIFQDAFLPIHLPSSENLDLIELIANSCHEKEDDNSEPVRYIINDSSEYTQEYKPTFKQRMYASTPNYLLITPKRKTQNGWFTTTQIKIPSSLEFPEIALKDKNDRTLYLQSCIVFRQDHYVAYIQKDDQWYLCDNAKITSVKLDHTEVQKDIGCYGVLLCYAKKAASLFYSIASSDRPNINDYQSCCSSEWIDSGKKRTILTVADLINQVHRRKTPIIKCSSTPPPDLRLPSKNFSQTRPKSADLSRTSFTSKQLNTSLLNSNASPNNPNVIPLQEHPVERIPASLKQLLIPPNFAKKKFAQLDLSTSFRGREIWGLRKSLIKKDS